MRKLLALLCFGLCFGISACSNVQQAASQAIPPVPKTPVQTVYEIKGALVAAEDAIDIWAASKCASPSSCHDDAVRTVMQAVVSADTIVGAAETAARANAVANDNVTEAINDAQAALAALQKLMQQYNINQPKGA